MKLRYKYQIYPNKSQEQQMIAVGGSVRFVFNHFLKKNIDQYQLDKKFIWYNDTCKQLIQMKKDLPWLTETYSQVIQQSLKDLDQALKNIKHGYGFPRFKSKYTTPISFRYQQHTSISDDRKYLNLPKIGAIRIKLHRQLPSRYTGCTIYQNATGWYASFVVEQNAKELTNITNSVGVDVNSEYTALSSGGLIQNPRPLQKSMPQIKQLQRKLSKKQKSSKNRIKAKQQLARKHAKIANKRINHIHQLSSRIAKDYSLVSVETLKIEEMKKNRYAAKAIADAGWAMLATEIEYKCELFGHHFFKINQWLPSSKTCSSCGTKKTIMPLNIRSFECNNCGVEIHRDINAAKNIDNWGRQQWMIQNSRWEPPEAPVDVTWDILTNYGSITQSQTKQEAATS